MGKYRILVASRVDGQLLRHTEFLSRVSIPAAKRFRNEYVEVLKCLMDNPYQFPPETDRNLPEGVYRRAIFAKRYKALFSIKNDTVFLDAVVDCRQDVSGSDLFDD